METTTRSIVSIVVEIEVRAGATNVDCLLFLGLLWLFAGDVDGVQSAIMASAADFLRMDRFLPCCC